MEKNIDKRVYHILARNVFGTECIMLTRVYAFGCVCFNVLKILKIKTRTSKTRDMSSTPY
jgi:hypothetical protein